MKFLLYTSRGGYQVLMKDTRMAWDQLVERMETDDGCSIAEARKEGWWVDGGTYKDGHVSIDDGGRIETIELTPIKAWTNRK